MKTSNKFFSAFGSLVVMLFVTKISVAQSFNVNKSASQVKIEGTSNVHDWEIDARDFQGSMNAQIENSKIVDISKLDFTVVSESLKSGKSGMDNNAYKALKTNKHGKISYTLDKVNNITCETNGQCIVATSGSLSIAGTKKPVNITFKAQVNNNKVVLSGSEKIKMTNYNVEPPTAMFGAITTGDDLTINFQTEFTK